MKHFNMTQPNSIDVSRYDIQNAVFKIKIKILICNLFLMQLIHRLEIKNDILNDGNNIVNISIALMLSNKKSLQKL